MGIYKSVEGGRLVLERYKAFLKCWPVPNQQLRVPTSQGETFVVASGPPGAPALLLLHGGAANSAMWMGEVAAFAHRFRVYCVDIIGEAGLSAPARPPLASEAHAVWLDDVLNHLSVARTSIAGISLGGWLALDYAIRRPARVERVAVLCPGGIGRQKAGIILATLLSRMFGRHGKRWLMERILGRAPVDPPPPVKAFLDFGALIHRHLRPRMVKLHFSDRALAGVRVPLLAIVGARDLLFDSAQTKRRLNKLVPSAQVVYLREAGHLIVGQTARVLEFLAYGMSTGDPNAARTPPLDTHLIAALAAGDASTRLKAALAIGSNPEPGLVDVLVARCAIEPDFYVRDMLTWALTRLPSEITLPRLLAELRSERAQARSQSLHTLSKIKDAGAWPAITRSLLRDSDDEVARSAWRAAVALVPRGQEKDLAEELAAQLGRGDREVQLSLSRALVALGEEAVGPTLRKAMASGDPGVHAHASATERLLRDPDAGSEPAVNEAKRIFALGKERNAGTAC